MCMLMKVKHLPSEAGGPPDGEFLTVARTSAVSGREGEPAKSAAASPTAGGGNPNPYTLKFLVLMV